MCISWVLFIIVIMMIYTKKLVCGVFSYKTASVILLTLPVMSFIQSFLIKCIEAENIYEEVQLTDFVMFIIACVCIIGLIGIELKKIYLIIPAYLTIVILIISSLATCISNFLFYFDFKKGQFSSHFSSTQFQYAVIVELMTLYASRIIATLILELFGEHPLTNPTQASKSKPSSGSEAPTINV